MKYFSSLFDDIDYDFGLNNPVKIKNIFKQYKIDVKNDEILKLEHIYANETLHEISYRLYGTIDYWWVLAFLNDIKDWFDVYYNDNIFMSKAQYLAEQYFQNDPNVTNEEFQEKYLEYYKSLKENQRTAILIIDNAYINDVVIDIIQQIKN